MDNLYINEVTQKYQKKNIANFKPGDTVRVYQQIIEEGKKRIQVFEGVVIAKHKDKSLDATFTVRKIASGVGVERIFPLHSPRILKIEKVKSAKVRRAKLYYLRGLSARARRLKKEEQTYEVWEEKGAEEEIQKVEVAQAKEAGKKMEAKETKEEKQTEEKKA
jgi:large subunit ribosomal protein L19